MERTVYGPYHSSSGHLFWVEYADRKTRSIWVHRDVMEQKPSRKLLRGEIVHHINHDKTDNRAENLEVMDRASHARHHRIKGLPTTVEVSCATCGAPLTRTRRHVMRRDGRGKTPKCSTCRRTR